MGKKTVRYYTDSGIYKGWEYIKEENELGYISWLMSGNSLRVKGLEYNVKYAIHKNDRKYSITASAHILKNLKG